MLFLTETEVRELLPMSEAIGLLEAAFKRQASGESLNQPRRRLILGTGSVLHYMTASDGAYFGAKIYSTHPRHGAHFLFLLYRAEDARPLAMLEANYLGQIRTGAASALATRYMAPEEASTVGLIGSGFQARSQLEAMAAVRPIRRARVWSRKPENRERLAAECGPLLGFAIDPVDSAREAVEGAQIIITATSAKEPVLEADWVAPGAHVNAMGSNQAQRRELSAELVRKADLIAVDSMEQARMESGDLLLAFDENDWRTRKILELKEIVSKGHLKSGDGLTIFKSNGLALEDVACAGYILEKAGELGWGKEIPILYS